MHINVMLYIITVALMKLVIKCISLCVSSVSLYKGGKVNWEALGQEATRCILKEVESVAMIDKKYGNGSREPPDKADWR